MKHLVIDRRRWLRGEGSAFSLLQRNDDGKLCCVGIYLDSLGAPKLSGTGTAAELSCLPEEAGWLVDSTEGKKGWQSTMLACLLYETNDLVSMPAEEREARITELFAQAGVSVEFTGEA